MKNIFSKIIFLLISLLLLPISISAWVESDIPVPTMSISSIGGAGGGDLVNPTYIVSDSTGKIYVSDTSSNIIQVFNSSYVFQYEIGSDGDGNGEFSNPNGLAVDSSNNLFVVDTHNSRIQKFNSSGVYQSQFGTEGTGDGQFTLPSDIAIDSDNNIYVLEPNSSRIQKFNSSGVFVTKWGTIGSGDGEFIFPNGIAVDSSNNIYVADTSNHRIQKFNSSGVFVSKFGVHGSAPGELNTPRDIALDSSGNLYIEDGVTPKIQKFNSLFVYQSLIAGGTPGTGDGQFDTFSSVHTVFDTTSGDLLITDGRNKRVQIISTSGSFIDKFGNPPAFGSPYDVTLADNHIFVADRGDNKVSKFTMDGLFVMSFGTPGTGDGQFNNVWSIIVDNDGFIYVSDSQNHRIQKFDSEGVFVTKWGTSGSGDGQFSFPTDLQFNNAGNLMVADSNNQRIQIFNTSGVFQDKIEFDQGIGPGQTDWFEGFVLDEDENIYITDAYMGRVEKFDSDGTFISEFGSFGNDPGQLQYPTGIALDDAGNIYVTDPDTEMLHKFSEDGEFLYRFGGSGTNLDDLPNPNGIFIDSDAKIYIADSGNDRIVIYTPDRLPPVGGVEILDVNNGIIESNTVQLDLEAEDELSNVESMIISESPTFDLATPEDYGAIRTYNFDDTQGEKTIYVKYTDEFGNESEVYSTSVLYDNSGPTGSVKINNGAQTTTSHTVTLKISATDPSDVEKMKISLDPFFSDDKWVNYATSKEIELPSGTGVRYVYIKFLDSLGNKSHAYSDSITIVSTTQTPTDDDSEETPDTDTVTTDPQTGYKIQLLDSDGKPISGATMSIGGTTYQSDDEGYFTLSETLDDATSYTITIDGVTQDGEVRGDKLYIDSSDVDPEQPHTPTNTSKSDEKKTNYIPYIVIAIALIGLLWVGILRTTKAESN